MIRRFTYSVLDRKDGKRFLGPSRIDAINKTVARRAILDEAKRNTPRGRSGSPRDLGYVPVSDYRIVWHDSEERAAPV